jgi:hypothetical protein
MMTKKKILKALFKLGATPEEVRQYLVANDYKGRCSSPNSCPIAIFLKDNGVDLLSVSNDGFIDPATKVLKIWLSPNFFQRLLGADVIRYYFLHREYIFAQAVSEFIIAFDQRQYPELILEGHYACK